MVVRSVDEVRAVMHAEETTGETAGGRGSENPYSPGSYRTAGGLRV